jgi:polyisoprenyl-teichoic acid--peptidoglycan teichoic acid transferase
VEEFLGVPINYYAQVDFNAFTEFVDAIGGIEIDVPYEIVVDPIGEANTLTLAPGRQLIYGSVALGYARNRHTDGNDFDRAARTQQVIMGIRDKIINLNMLPTLITKAPALYQQISAGVHTNLSLDQVVQLALLAQQIPSENIKQVVIGPEEVSNGTSPDGLSILKPITDKIRIKRDEMFTSSGPLSPMAAASSDTDLVKAEAARVQIQNGTYVPGLGGRTTEYLTSLGLTTLEPANATEVLDSTTIYDYSGKPYTIRYLVELLHINENRIFNRYDPNAGLDIVVVVGNDWANSNSMP